MILKVPSYYEKFHCIADQCKDNCCYGWEIDIDEGTMDYYRSLGGELGKEITSHIREGEENTMIMREDGYCPFLNEKKLCDICIKMGEEALSEICTEFPRFTMEYEDVREKILSLACEEVGNIMFSTDEKITWQEHEMPDFCGTGTMMRQCVRTTELCTVMMRQRVRTMRPTARRMTTMRKCLWMPIS